MKWKYLALVIFIMILLVLLPSISCTEISSNTISPGTQVITQSVVPVAVKDVDAREAVEIIQSNNQNPDFIILDVRTPDEYNSGHIAQAINIDFQSSNFSSNIGRLNSEKTYLVYCKAGGRSAAATQSMRQLGFKEIFNLTGGITQWTNEGYSIVQ
jgi:rhodanese-related sulfurtransferase